MEGDQLLGTGRWLSLHKRPYVDPNGTTRVRNVCDRCGGDSLQYWEVCRRTTRKGDVDAVEIFAVIKTPGKPDEMLIVRQFRPPLMKDLLELPAGLVDEGETCAQAAIRELKEETGYHGKVVYESEIVTADPGLTDATFRLVHIEIDGSAPENQNPKQHLEGSEFITVLRMPVHGFLEALRAQKNCMIDGKVLNLAFGLQLGRAAAK